MVGRDEDIRGKHLYLDCYSGIAGDMFLGAALDLGVPREPLEAALAGLALEGFRLQVGRRSHLGLSGTDVRVAIDEGSSQKARGYPAIRALIEASELSQGVKARALDMFRLVAEAEGRVHGVEPERVHFHEVGAVDSIVDIVGSAFVLEYLQPRCVSARPVPLGSGFVETEHGRMPVPAPAALEILRGAEVQDGGAPGELCTPTGAAIVAHCVDRFEELPKARLCAVGYGAGDRALADRPNHLRMVLLENGSTVWNAADSSDLVVIESNVDDMNPEWCDHLSEGLFAAGARDVWFVPIVMKKGRPALTICALCEPTRRDELVAVMMRESTSIGVRSYEVSRQELERGFTQVETPYGCVELKVARGERGVINVAPEYESCRAVADAHDLPLKVVYAVALSHYYRGADGESSRDGANHSDE